MTLTSTDFESNAASGRIRLLQDAIVAGRLPKHLLQLVETLEEEQEKKMPTRAQPGRTLRLIGLPGDQTQSLKPETSSAAHATASQTFTQQKQNISYQNISVSGSGGCNTATDSLLCTSKFLCNEHPALLAQQLLQNNNADRRRVLDQCDGKLARHVAYLLKEIKLSFL